MAVFLSLLILGTLFAWYYSLILSVDKRLTLTIKAVESEIIRLDELIDARDAHRRINEEMR